MNSFTKNIINTRQDLDAVKGTPEAVQFMKALKGSIYRTIDVQKYPDNYHSPEYVGDKLEPVWDVIKDLSTIERFNFVESDFDSVE